MSNERFSRQVLAFGEEGQKKLSAARIGIVGVGGIGSQIVQDLAYIGVENFLIVDDDIVEESNLNRLVGALPIDAREKRLKVDVTERMIMQINPEARVMKLGMNLRDEKVLDALTHTDYLFGCVDNDSARLILTELAAAFEILLIESAAQIHPEEGWINGFGGRVIIACPGEFCALCANQIDVKIAKIELESPPEKEFREKHGYGMGSEVTAPAVISLNGIIANLAVTEFLMFLTGIRPYNRMVVYKGMEGKVNVRIDKKKEDCVICNSLVGKRESADLKRYARIGLPKDLPI
jgi:molybdopterin/thiamine biosynthesis adenylyltransferase